jgi:arginase family enzyme
LSANPNLKVLWVDAHADFVNPYIKGVQNQNYHGMPLSHISGVHDLPGFEWMK